MRRGVFIAGLAATALPSALIAQQRTPKRLGVLATTRESDQEWKAEVGALLERLEALGWTVGQNLEIDYRFGMGEVERLGVGAKDLVRLQPDLLLARSTPAVRALVNETRTVPIVFVSVADPVGERLAASIARPGANTTGFTNVEAAMGGKWLELLKEIAPRVRRVAVLHNPGLAVGAGQFFMPAIEKMANRLALSIEPAPVQDAAEIMQRVAQFAREPRGALVVPPDVFVVANRGAIIEVAARHGLPAVYAFRNMSAEGGLLSYGVDVVDLYRRSADYLDRILRGASPSELPIQGPAKFDLVVNLKTAKALGLSISPTLLARADEVIE